jgi:hypothetical protein
MKAHTKGQMVLLFLVLSKLVREYLGVIMHLSIEVFVPRIEFLII